MKSGGAIVVFNAGSSSLKYRLFSGEDGVAGDVIEHIGEPGAPVGDHCAAVADAVNGLRLAQRDVAAIGHRVVHGGTRFTAPVVLDDEALAGIDELAPFAPLHNPAAAAGIRAAWAALPGVTQVAVFDTAFHATLPPPAAAYALDAALAQRHGIRRFGFHGISVRYVVAAAARLLGRPVEELNLVVLHLGNGASATAVAGGVSVETSMGMTPLEGLVMGTRTGDLDPAVTFHLLHAAGLTPDAIEDLYQHHGGLSGLCGDNDVRVVQSRVAAGDPAATLALDAYCHRIRKYVGAYHAVLGRLDGIVFTAGVGEHSSMVRGRALAGLAALGIVVDEARNTAGPASRLISADDARVAVCVVPTDEERAIAQEVAALLDLTAGPDARTGPEALGR
jgi:acetate kinase